MNQVNLIGRTTKELELKNSSGGKKYVAFTLAVNDFGNENTNFISCFAWEKNAENLVKFVKKGSKILVEGQLKVRQDNNDGQFKSVWNVNVNKFEFLESKNVISKDDDSILWGDE